MQTYSILHDKSKLKTWLCYLECQHNKNVIKNLEHVKCIAKKLKLMHPAKTVFTIAGTNGKGTTCRILEMILLNSNIRVGVYSSPHLFCYTERVRIQGKQLKQSEFSRSFSMIKKNRGNSLLTYFEFSTLSALYLFKQAKLDAIILEVGLGGRLDATNIIHPSVAVITNIALDHTNILGKNIESIGREKAGIFRSKKPAIIGEKKILKSIQQAADKINAPLYYYGKSWNYIKKENSWTWENNKTLLIDLPIPYSTLDNASTALAALSYSSLNISKKAICSGLQTAYLPGRFQLIQKEPRLILDVGHNPHAAKYLASRLSELPRNNSKVRAVVSMLPNKDIVGFLECLSHQVDKFYYTVLKEKKNIKNKLLTQLLSQHYYFDNVEIAWKQAMKDSNKEDIVIVCGSFHAVLKIMMLNKDNIQFLINK
ncbi:Dihydrofolate synthase/folylpolyglutamate synthase [Candidatus Ecksteinia adelgidicola]|nr:Dihydrofolate synthase/folylpolyglutamate synthase [Candidatus Ecksteinia adelgidicola]